MLISPLTRRDRGRHCRGFVIETATDEKNVHWRDAMNGVRFNQINVTRMFRVAVQWNDILLPVF